MNLFQLSMLTLLGGLLLWELVTLWRGPTAFGFWLLRCLAWIAAAVAIANPGLLQTLASLLGIGRGADVVLYAFALAFLGSSFYFYSRYVRLQRELTQVVRHLAIYEAQKERVEIDNPNN